MRWMILVALLLVPTLCWAQSPSFDFEQYHRLEEEMQQADEHRAGCEEGTDVWERATWDAIDTRRTLIGFFETVLDAGALDTDTLDRAENARLILIENVVSLLIDLGECEEAQRDVELIAEFANHENDDFRAVYEEIQWKLLTCGPSFEEIAPDDEDPLAPTATTPERSTAWAGPTVVAAGAAVLIAAVVVDVNRMNTFDEFQASRDTYYETGSATHYTRAEDLAAEFDDAKSRVVGLYSASAVLVTTGMLLWILLDDDDDQRSSTSTVQVRPAFLHTRRLGPTPMLNLTIELTP